MIRAILWELKSCYRTFIPPALIFIFIFTSLCQSVVLTFSIRKSFYQSYDNVLVAAYSTLKETHKIKQYDGYQTGGAVYYAPNALLSYNGYPYFSTEALENVEPIVEGRAGAAYYYNDAFFKYLSTFTEITERQSDGIFLSEPMAEKLNVKTGDKVTFHTLTEDGAHAAPLTVSGIYPRKKLNAPYIVNIDGISLNLNDHSTFYAVIFDFDLYDEIKTFFKENLTEVSGNETFERLRATVLTLELTFAAIAAGTLILSCAIIKELCEYIFDIRKSYIFTLKALGGDGKYFAAVYSVIFCFMCLIPTALAAVSSNLLLSVLSNKFTELFGIQLVLQGLWITPVFIFIVTILIFFMILMCLGKRRGRRIYTLLRSTHGL